MTVLEKQNKINQFKKDFVENMVDVYDKFPDCMKHLNDNFWDLLVSNDKIKYERRELASK